jgi:predicted CoA-binding protein
MSHPSLLAIPEEIRIDTVVIFRRSDQVLPVVEEAVARGVRVI